LAAGFCKPGALTPNCFNQNNVNGSSCVRPGPLGIPPVRLLTNPGILKPKFKLLPARPLGVPLPAGPVLPDTYCPNVPNGTTGKPIPDIPGGGLAAINVYDLPS